MRNLKSSLAMKSGRKCKFYYSSPCRYNLPHSKLADFFLHSYEAYVIQWTQKSVSTKATSVFKDPETLSIIHDVLIPVDKSHKTSFLSTKSIV
jgi:hypothetical protein